LLQKYLLLGH